MRKLQVDHVAASSTQKYLEPKIRRTKCKIVRNITCKVNGGIFTLLEKLPIGAAIVSPETSDIKYANRVCLNILGVKTINQKNPLNWRDCLPTNSYQKFYKKLTHTISRNSTLAFHPYLIRRPDGNIRNVKVYFSDTLADIQDYTLIYLIDVTQQTNQERVVSANFQDMLDAFSYRIIDVQEDERRRISYELHDEIGQNLTALQLLIKAYCEQEQPKPALKRKLEGLIKTSITQIRRFSHELNPATGSSLGLLSVLQEYFNRYQIWSGLTVKFLHAGLEGKEFSDAISNTVYRVIQESLTNIARHAKAKDAEVKIRVTNETIHIRVLDKGQGFDPQKLLVRRSGGIWGIHERLLLLKGKLKIESTPGKGTCLKAEIPLSAGKTKKGQYDINSIGG